MVAAFFYLPLSPNCEIKATLMYDAASSTPVFVEPSVMRLQFSRVKQIVEHIHDEERYEFQVSQARAQ